MRISWLGTGSLVLVGLLALPLATAAKDQGSMGSKGGSDKDQASATARSHSAMGDSGRKASKEEGKDEATSPRTREEAAEARPQRRGNKTYRERINTVAREPLRKEVPDGPRTPEERRWSGVRDARPLVARKRTHPPRPEITRFDHVKMVARGPITRPPKNKDEKR